MKTCYKCKIPKELNAFCKNKSYEDGRNALCKECVKVRRKKYYPIHKKRISIGCSIPEFKFYIEGKFSDGMTWENYGYHGWHLDHIIPLAFYDLSNREQFLKAVHYTNLQPLWARDNFAKSGKVFRNNSRADVPPPTTSAPSSQ